MLKGAVLGVVVAAGSLAALLAPSPAQAYWVRGGWGYGWRAPVVVVPPVAYVPGPPVRVVPAPLWVRPHYDRWGRFIPGHWHYYG